MAVKKAPPAPTELSTGHPIQDVLRVWRSLEQVIMVATESDLHLLLVAEKEGRGRHLFLQRIYGRMTKVRAKTEMDELRAAIKDV